MESWKMRNVVTSMSACVSHDTQKLVTVSATSFFYVHELTEVTLLPGSNKAS